MVKEHPQITSLAVWRMLTHLSLWSRRGQTVHCSSHRTQCSHGVPAGPPEGHGPRPSASPQSTRRLDEQTPMMP